MSVRCVHPHTDKPYEYIDYTMAKKVILSAFILKIFFIILNL